MPSISIESRLKGFKIYKTLKVIVKFLTKEIRVQEIFKKIGEQEFNAALKSLNDAQFSKEPKREIESAITIFRLALEREIPRTTKITVLLYVSYIYKLLGENSLQENFLEKAKVEFEEYCKVVRQSALAMGLAGESSILLLEGLSWVFAATNPLSLSQKIIQASVQEMFSKKRKILLYSYEVGTIYKWSIETGEIGIQKEIEDFSEIVILIAN